MDSPPHDRRPKRDSELVAEDRRCSLGVDAVVGKPLCEHHLAQSKSYQKKRRTGAREGGSGEEDGSENNKSKKKRAASESETESEQKAKIRKGKSSKIKGSLMCHQCQRNDKSGVVHCSQCKAKRFCYECIEKWYPGKTKDGFADACPFCCGNCNCKACLREFLVKPCREVEPSVKLQRLRYLLYKALPVVRHIYSEQSFELEVEAKIRGVHLTEMDIKRTK
ncbi:lysine-specific demethylase JMJ27-like [Argentina anserina]|uniref:lysine-specific demethylase JMJ27-like n=1 Tax=Argentina anserina TaxID=57926 RepID=UPI00217641E5|nr:lysine-specific demethylase JMJ27-like [Potentilla anserina]